MFRSLQLSLVRKRFRTASKQYSLQAVLQPDPQLVAVFVGVLGFVLALWFLVGNGGMDPYDSPLRSLIVVPITHTTKTQRARGSVCYNPGSRRST